MKLHQILKNSLPSRLPRMAKAGRIKHSSRELRILTCYRPVDVGVAETWDPGFGDFMRNAYHYHPKNLDHNSGDPLGISVCQLSAHEGKRVTASGAYLTSKAPNLTITTDTAVTKIIIEDGKAVGVEVDERRSSSTSYLLKHYKEKLTSEQYMQKRKLFLPQAPSTRQNYFSYLVLAQQGISITSKSQSFKISPALAKIFRIGCFWNW